MKIVSSEAMARIDSRSRTEFAFPSSTLLEDAGVKAWASVRRVIWSGTRRGRLVFLAGRGNNGGDALRHGPPGRGGACAPAGDHPAGGRPAADSEPGRMLAICEALGDSLPGLARTSRCSAGAPWEADWVFDGIAGTGIHGALRPPFPISWMPSMTSPGKKIAIDVPSGLGDEYPSGPPRAPR